MSSDAGSNLVIKELLDLQKENAELKRALGNSAASRHLSSSRKHVDASSSKTPTKVSSISLHNSPTRRAGKSESRREQQGQQSVPKSQPSLSPAAVEQMLQDMFAAIQSSEPGDKEGVADYQAAMRFAARWRGLLGVPGSLKGTARDSSGSTNQADRKSKASFDQVQIGNQNLTHEVHLHKVSPIVANSFFVPTQ
jgi:hypothetical protein